MTDEFNRQGPRLTDANAWRSVMRELLPSTLEVAAPRLVEAVRKEHSDLVGLLRREVEGGLAAGREEMVAQCLEQLAKVNRGGQGFGFQVSEMRVRGFGVLS